MEQDRPGDDGQVQPRVQVLRQVEWMQQVSGQGGKSACRSGSGLVRVTRFRHSPVATRQDNMVEIGPRLGWEVNTWVRAQINGSVVWGSSPQLCHLLSGPNPSRQTRRGCAQGPAST